MSETPAERCRRYRRRILEISRQVEAAHVAPAFSCLEMVDCLYHDVMREQDVFIMSKGHGCLAQYVVLEDVGNLPRAALDAYCKFQDPSAIDAPPSLGAHPDYAPGIGIHASTGSLGHGLGIAVGQALAEKIKGTGARIYVLLSDGECQEGSTWEAAMVAANLGLGKLTALVDANGWGGMDRTDRVSGVFPALDPLLDKFYAFGWRGFNFHGHVRMSELIAWLRSNKERDRPQVAVCRTTKGRDVSFIEDGLPLWHYKSPSAEEYELAMRELEG